MTYQLNNEHSFIYDPMDGGSGLSNGLEANNLLTSNDNNSWSLYEENSVLPSSGAVASATAASSSAAAATAGPGRARYSQLSVLQWSPQNCMEWGLQICQKYSIDKLCIDIGALGQTNGPQLMKSTQLYFCLLLGDQYGHIFYKELQKLKNIASVEVNRRYLDFHNSNIIDPSQYSVNLDSYTPSMDSYSTNYRYHNSYNNTEMVQSDYSIPLDQCITTMDSFSTNFGSSYSDENAKFKESPQYTLNSDKCITNIDYYNTNYQSLYSDNNPKIDQNPYTLNSEQSIISTDSYSKKCESHYSDNNEIITMKLEEGTTIMDSISENYKTPYSENSSYFEENHNSVNLNPYHPISNFQDLPESVKSEFELNGNLEDFDSENDVTIDSEDTTWDLPEDTWKQIDITNLNLDVNFDEFVEEDTVKIDTPKKAKRTSGNGQSKKKPTKSIPKINFSADCVEGIIKKTQGVAKRERCPRSWEFLIRLLMNSETNPSVIRWEDESQYIFRLVKPEAVVQIWNAKSVKASPNKDNFARSLRYHYKKGILIPVPEKQLVYQCGPKAIDYMNILRKTLK